MRAGPFLASLFLLIATPSFADPVQDAVDAVTDARIEIEIALFHRGYAAGLADGFDRRGPSWSERMASAGSDAYDDGYRRGVSQGRADRAAAGI